MHALARNGPLLGLIVTLLAPLSSVWAVTAVVGLPAPDLSLPSIHVEAPADDDLIRLAEYRGKVVYLDFWSSWCAPCRRAMPGLDALRSSFSRSDFEIISVNVDAVVADARRFLRQVPVRHPVAVDGGGAVAARYGVAAVPAGFLIDRDGVVREAILGTRVEDHASLRAKLERLIEGDGIR